MLKELSEFPTYYVDEEGNVYGTKNSKKMYKLTPYMKNGYLRVRLRKNSRAYDKSVASLVAMEFVEGYREGLEVNHKNKIRNDNRATNLEWMTRRENVRYSLCKKLEVTTKSGLKLYYDSVTDFCNDVGQSTSNFVRWYMKRCGGYMKNHQLFVRYIEEIV